MPATERPFNPTNAAIVVCDEDPTLSLVEKTRLEKSALRAIMENDLGKLILEGLDAQVGLLTYFRERGIAPEQLRDAADRLRQEEWRRGQISNPDASDTVLGKAVASAAPLVRLSGVLERLADEAASGRHGAAYSLLVDREHLIAQGRRQWAFHERRLLVLDGTADPQILKEFVPSLETVPEIRVRRNARIVQVRNATFYKGSLVKRRSDPNGNGNPEATKRLREVAEFVTRTALKSKTLVVINKPVRCALTGEDEHSSLSISTQYRGADIAHFGNLRGSNAFEEHETVIVLDETSPA